MTRMLCAALTASTCLTAPALAQDFVDLGTITLFGSLVPVELGRTGANVEVVEGEDIAERDDAVIDALVRLPGVNATSNGGLGAQAALQVRGLPARYVSVFVEGINVSDPSGVQNQFNVGPFLGAGLDRIEVLTGSQSTLYGSEAIAGVINVTTFRPETLGVSGRAQVEAGSFGTFSGATSIGYLTERGEVAFTYSFVDSEGISAQSGNTELDGFRQTALTFTFEHDLTDALTIGGAVLYTDSDVEIDRSATNPAGDNFSEEVGARLYATFDTGAVAHTFSYSFFDIDRRDPTGFTTRFQGERQTLSYLGTADLGAATTLSFGLDRTLEEIDTGGTTGDETTTAALAELLYSPNDAVDISLALRYDENSDFGGAVTGRAALAWRPSEDWTIRALVGTGYRAPSLFERFSSFGDPNLEPETSLSVELGLEHRLGDRGTIGATLFYTEIDDLIGFDGASTACGSGFGCYNQVPGTTISRGFEVSGDYAVNDMISVYGAYTYTDARTDGERLTRTPRHDLVLGAEADITGALSAYADLRHVADVLPSPFAPADNLVGDYTLVGFGASYEVSNGLEAYLRVENAFDEDYETAGGFNTPGRAIYVGIRAAF